MSLRPPQGYSEPTHRLPEQATAPVVMADGGTVYSKDIAGISELCYEDSGAKVTQITDDGAVAGAVSPGGSADGVQINNGAGGFGARLAINSSDQLLADDGTLAAPAIAAASDTNTGIAFGVGGVDNFSAVAGGIECIRFSDSGSTPGRMLTSVPFQPLLGTAALPAIAMATNEAYGLFSRTANAAFGTTMAGVQHGWECGRFGAAQFFFAITDEHQTSPVTLCSIGNWVDLDTGISFGTDTSASVGLFTAGVECLRCAPGSELITHPALANSTGAVSDTAAVQTTDATQTTLHTLTLADNTTYAVSVTVAGRDTAGTERCSYIRYVQAHRQGGGAATISAVSAPFSVESDAGLDATFTVNSNDLRLSITGKAGTTINWSASINYIGSE